MYVAMVGCDVGCDDDVMRIQQGTTSKPSSTPHSLTHSHTQAATHAADRDGEYELRAAGLGVGVWRYEMMMIVCDEASCRLRLLLHHHLILLAS